MPEHTQIQTYTNSLHRQVLTISVYAAWLLGGHNWVS